LTAEQELQYKPTSYNHKRGLTLGHEHVITLLDDHNRFTSPPPTTKNTMKTCESTSEVKKSALEVRKDSK